MASFETFGFDENDLIPSTIELECPVCHKPLEIPLERTEDFVVCPHCDSKIEIQSSQF